MCGRWDGSGRVKKETGKEAPAFLEMETLRRRSRRSEGSGGVQEIRRKWESAGDKKRVGECRK